MLNIDLIHGDCFEVLRGMEAESVDAIVTDPPYGLSFMSKRWDYDVPSEEIWRECLRVLKPGGHLLAFAGTRTQHRMAVRIEDAGFEIRDMIAWVYGSGFPKSLDVSKAIDKAAGVEGTFGEAKSAAHAGWIERGRMRGEEGHDGYQRPWMADADAVDRNARKYIGATEAARQWAGWGTALKPALEPITVARKPLVGTVAANVLEHGTGAINVDGCRVIYDRNADDTRRKPVPSTGWCITSPTSGSMDDSALQGRWPANLLHDGSEEVVGLFPQTTSNTRNPNGGKIYGRNSLNESATCDTTVRGFSDSGSAARFFYCAKASKADRDEGCEELAAGRNGALNLRTDSHSQANGMDTGPRHNHHPTVKPTALMRYLCRLVTPPGGVVLDPFMGSGSTGKAAVLEGFRFIGIEREAEYVEIARARIAAVKVEPKQGDLFTSAGDVEET